MRFKTLSALAACMSFSSAFAAGLDGASLEYGRGPEVAMVRLAVQSNWDKRWFESNGTHVAGYWEGSLAQWRGDAYQNIEGQRQNITSIGITPMFRLRADDGKGWYLEGGIGLHLLSKLYDNDSNMLSTRYQFGDQLGVGYAFRNGWETGMTLVHYSNGGIKKPNSGVNFLMLRAAKSF
ncbi:acyloxyacyl hydrolase [Massilia sp. CF038]|uniref:acyloxyacyl hydrolase n=1 Tax=Massilia sp. CF038 TaxID=1881045 RepID=UPI000913B2BC|nr:acyloxyacyl hydrolase [Massilia sp. CF038]SHH57439.1 Lipid A 3-O-deacylase (PagL) [Massilia sp. CF038]